MTCDAESYGFACDREAGHGDIHRDRGNALNKDQLWVLDPVNEDEAIGRKPMSGYRMLTDTLLKEIK